MIGRRRVVVDPAVVDVDEFEFGEIVVAEVLIRNADRHGVRFIRHHHAPLDIHADLK